MGRASVQERVERAAQAALAAEKSVSTVDVLLRIGWLAPTHIDHWRQGRVDCLESTMQVNPDKLSAATTHLVRWAERRGLAPSETDYVARTPDRRTLRFSVGGSATVERAYRTHWMSPELSASQRARRTERSSRPPDLVVISPLKDWSCATCSGTGDLLLMQDGGPVCLSCAGLDHLEFLPSGDAGLTRRAHRASELSAVVVRFSRTRKRYERQGLLVEPAALEGARRGSPNPEPP